MRGGCGYAACASLGRLRWTGRQARWAVGVAAPAVGRGDRSGEGRTSCESSSAASTAAPSGVPVRALNESSRSSGSWNKRENASGCVFAPSILRQPAAPRVGDCTRTCLNHCFDKRLDAPVQRPHFCRFSFRGARLRPKGAAPSPQPALIGALREAGRPIQPAGRLYCSAMLWFNCRAQASKLRQQWPSPEPPQPMQSGLQCCRPLVSDTPPCRGSQAAAPCASESRRDEGRAAWRCAPGRAQGVYRLASNDCPRSV